jgi:hypothetical protein
MEIICSTKGIPGRGRVYKREYRKRDQREQYWRLVGKTSKRLTSLGVRGLCTRLVSHQSREVQVPYLIPITKPNPTKPWPCLIISTT